MVDQEKVITDLETAVQDFNRYGRDEYGRETAYAYVKADVLEDAIALLKALDVTPEELERLKMCRVECKIDCLLEHYNKVKDELDAMKKAQEPVEPKAIDTSNSKLYHSDMFKNYYCGNCGEFLHIVNRKDLFCSLCGRAVKWNG